EGQTDFVCMTDRAGAKLEISYKGAHASRPADQVDVDEFVGVKSHRAKGKRLTTYEVAALRFIEPELPPDPDPAPADEADDADASGETGFDGTDFGIEDSMDGGGTTDAAETAEGASAPTAVSEEVAFEIERPRGDADEVIDPEQLNLF
ncbi:MAG: DNA gyrase/topoisomerase IV subunit A, partial [Alistipes sp.]|nr:DNA gyrase/topoisomerase IV subunit A [Alistipes sp.]